MATGPTGAVCVCHRHPSAVPFPSSWMLVGPEEVCKGPGGREALRRGITGEPTLKTDMAWVLHGHPMRQQDAGPLNSVAQGAGTMDAQQLP